MVVVVDRWTDNEDGKAVGLKVERMMSMTGHVIMAESWMVAAALLLLLLQWDGRRSAT